jgi:predicted Zn-dependent protease
MIKKLLFLLTVWMVAGLLSCDTIKKTADEINLFPVTDDIKLGQKLAAQIAADTQTYPVLPEATNAEVYAYVRKLRDAVLNSGKIKYRRVFKWDVKIIDDDKTLNAFVTPGGYIYVYTGLIKFLDSEDQLIGVMGHEIAHADRRHTTRQMTKSGALQMLVDAAIGKETAVTQVLEGVVGLKFSREHESEADEYSVQYLCGSSYDAAGFANFFVKMSSKGGQPPVFLSTHPAPATRVQDIKATKQTLGCKGTQTNQSEYQRIKAML